MSPEQRRDEELDAVSGGIEEEARDDEVLDEVQDDAVIGRALRASALVIVVVAALSAVVWWLASRPATEAAGPDIALEGPREVERPTGDASPPSLPFVDVTEAAGIRFVHESGASGERFLPETMGAGAAFFDYDQDGDQDLLLVNSTDWVGGDRARSALYENDGTGRFSERSRETGLDVVLYGTGVAVGDFDNDGYPDLFLAAVGENRLFHNRPADGGRSFVDITRRAGVGGDPNEWSSSSAFLDYDGDGDLDLFVGNYVRWSKEIDLEVGYTLTGIGRAYGPPLNYEGSFPYLYRNEGDGRFSDVSEESGVRVTNPATGGPVAKSLGVLPVDANLDGAIDLIVANDTVRNFYFRNLGNGRFEEVGELYGLAYGRDGKATGAMGIDVGDYRNDGSVAFAIGNFANEMTSLYVSQGDPTLYADEAIGEGIGAPSRRALTFGIHFLDADLDGRLDLLQVNGHLESEIGQVDPSQQYRQRAQLFWNAGDAGSRTWLEVEPENTGALATPIVGRGSAVADIDGDGDLDLLLLQTGDRPLLLRNDQSLGHHWLRVRVVGNGETSNRDAIGARVDLVAGGVRQRRFVTPARGYQSHSESVLTFGLGANDGVERLEIAWPDGATESRPVTAVDRFMVLEQGGGVE